MLKVKDKLFEHGIQDGWQLRALSYTEAPKMFEC